MYNLPKPPSLNVQNPLSSVPTPTLPSIPSIPSAPKLPLKRVSGLDYKKTFTETSTYKNLKTNIPTTIPSVPSVPSVPIGRSRPPSPCAAGAVGSGAGGHGASAHDGRRCGPAYSGGQQRWPQTASAWSRLCW